MKKVIAKFKCQSVHAFEGSNQVDLYPVVIGSDENKSFAKATPGGNLKMTIDNGTDAADLFVPGKNYYIVIQQVEE